MNKKVLAAALLAAGPLLAAEPEGFVVWPASDLKGYGQKLAPKMNAGKVATERLAVWSNHFAMIAHREGDGEAEVHEKQVDVFVVQDGEATLVVGGELDGGKATTPGEIRGGTIKGAFSKRPIAAGDIVHIPAKIPHQLLIPAGKKFTYFVVKVDTP